MHHKWDKKLIAHIDIKGRKIKSFHRFKHCIDSVKNKPKLCLLKNKCIIGLLINEINNMPFKKIKGGYKSPSGRKYTAKQVRAYYAADGWKRPPKKNKK